MPLIKNKKITSKVNLKGKEVSSEIYSKIEEYCSWAHIDDLGHFFEEAALHVFKSDKDWKKHTRSLLNESATI